jgi:hypothetical protein
MISSTRQNSAPTTSTSVATPVRSHSSAVWRAAPPEEQAALSTRFGPVQPRRWASSDPIDVCSIRGKTLGRGRVPAKKLSRHVRMSEMPVQKTMPTTGPGSQPRARASAMASSTAASTDRS